jgi:N-acyl-D-aspartate/D-glutamate deacylase
MMAGEGGSLAPQNERTLAELPRGELDAQWTRFDEYFHVLESKGIALNVVHNVGAEQVRRMVLGDEDVFTLRSSRRKAGWVRALVSPSASGGRKTSDEG